jgi:hypothetical protein
VGFDIELDPYYCDGTLKRMHKSAGYIGVLEGTNDNFETVAGYRKDELVRQQSSVAENSAEISS